MREAYDRFEFHRAYQALNEFTNTDLSAVYSDAVKDRLAEYLQGYRDIKVNADVFGAVLNTIENYGFAGTSSLAGRQKAIVSLVHGEIADVLSTVR